MLPFKDIISVLFFVGLSRAFIFSFRPSESSKYRDKCKTAAVTGMGTCTRAELCPDMFQDLDVKSLGTQSPEWTSEMIEYIYKSHFCGMKDDEKLFCCESPIELEDMEDVSNHPNLNLLDRDRCGPISQDRIAHGNKTQLFELPWMALLIQVQGNMYARFCGGSIINEKYILTAAHCVDDHIPTHVRLGEHDLRTPIDCQEHLDDDEKIKICAPPHQDIPVEKIIIHPKYTGKHYIYNDVALLRLSQPMDLTTDSMRPICLPVGMEQQSTNLIGKMVDISGWGGTEKGPSQELLKASLRVLESTKCNSFPPNSPYTQICVGRTSKGTNACPGDSGGPLVYYGEVNGSIRAIQYGVASVGSPECGEENGHSSYTRVGFYMKFILDNLER